MNINEAAQILNNVGFIIIEAGKKEDIGKNVLEECIYTASDHIEFLSRCDYFVVEPDEDVEQEHGQFNNYNFGVIATTVSIDDDISSKVLSIINARNKARLLANLLEKQEEILSDMKKSFKETYEIAVKTSNEIIDSFRDGGNLWIEDSVYFGVDK